MHALMACVTPASWLWHRRQMSMSRRLILIWRLSVECMPGCVTMAPMRLHSSNAQTIQPHLA